MEANEQDAKHSLLLRLFLLGFALAFFGVILFMVANWLGGDTTASGAVIIIIGFIPIIIGTGPGAFFTLIAAILTIIALLIFVWLRKHRQLVRPFCFCLCRRGGCGFSLSINHVEKS